LIFPSQTNHQQSTSQQTTANQPANQQPTTPLNVAPQNTLDVAHSPTKASSPKENAKSEMPHF